MVVFQSSWQFGVFRSHQANTFRWTWAVSAAKPWILVQTHPKGSPPASLVEIQSSKVLNVPLQPQKKTPSQVGVSDVRPKETPGKNGSQVGSRHSARMQWITNIAAAEQQTNEEQMGPAKTTAVVWDVGNFMISFHSKAGTNQKNLRSKSEHVCKWSCKKDKWLASTSFSTSWVFEFIHVSTLCAGSQHNILLNKVVLPKLRH